MDTLQVVFVAVTALPPPYMVAIVNGKGRLKLPEVLLAIVRDASRAEKE
jgi:hypothetical protein